MDSAAKAQRAEREPEEQPKPETKEKPKTRKEDGVDKIENNDINFIQKGVTSKNTLLKNLGSPTIVSYAKDKEVWIYYSENIKHILCNKINIILHE